MMCFFLRIPKAAAGKILAVVADTILGRPEHFEYQGSTTPE